jgi:hypothetical protein
MESELVAINHKLDQIKSMLRFLMGAEIARTVKETGLPLEAVDAHVRTMLAELQNEPWAQEPD